MKKALVLVDPQFGFVKGGGLPVPGGEDIDPYIASLERYDVEIATGDWHPKTHKSFAVNHPGKKPFVDVIQLNGKEQRLWPVHCEAGKRDAQFLPGISQRRIDFVVHKGMDPDVENYSPFFVNPVGRPKQGEILDAEGRILPFSNLVDFLHAQGITDVDAAGLATDVCVTGFVLDALTHQFKVRLLLKGCRGVAKETTDAALGQMWKAGAELVN